MTATLLADLVRAERLAVLTDLDGTLLAFAETAADARLDDEAASVLNDLLASGVTLVVVSGRPRATLEDVRARVPGVSCVAEHGGWFAEAGGAWTCAAPGIDNLGALADRLDDVARGFVGARIERKTASVCLHWRGVEERRRSELFDAADPCVEEWLDSHPDHERMAGVLMLEVGPRGRHKGAAVGWARKRVPDVHILAIGDDVTDEQMFAALTEEDVSVCVGRPDRPSHAGLMVSDVAGARHLLRWVVSTRHARDVGPPPVAVRPETTAADHRAAILVTSNRMPTPDRDGRRREVGGLVSALEPALANADAVWLGWSGQEAEGRPEALLDPAVKPTRAVFDLPPPMRRTYYNGFCNRALWPVLHGFCGRVRYEDDEWCAYVDANWTFASLATELVVPDAAIWAHDYHLLLLACALRERGHRGPIGLFLHVPFPSLDTFETVPWAIPLLDGMLAFDLLGFHTARWARNFMDAARTLACAEERGGRLHHRGHQTRVEVFPLGIDAAPFLPERAPLPAADIEGLRASLRGRKMLLGVDRLDYSKGIPERLRAFARMLERHPHWRGQVCFVQISVPSRADVPEYAQLRQEVEHLVGSINGQFGEADWSPVRYLYRSYTHEVLAQLYRAADVAVITPLRDGMNLVAKEFVAAQDPADPGVLVLSRFAGAAAELGSAIRTNPFHCDGLADDLDLALSMPLEERRSRSSSMRAAVLESTPEQWARRFLTVLDTCRAPLTRARSASR